MLAMVTTAFAAEKTVWEGSEPISWNTEVAPGTQFATPEGTFTGLAKGDIIRAYTTTTYDAPQYVMTYMKGDSWDWTDLETTFSNGVMTYTVADETIATEIATRWIVFRGQAYTLTKITVETPESGGETTGTVIWEGSTTLDWGADPGVSVSLEASKFANAKAGDVLKIEGTADEWIQVQVCVNYPWKASDSYTALPISYTIAEEDLENIKANGMTIAGQYATITKVTLTTAEEPDPQPAAGETYTAWTGEKVFTSEWSVWEQIPASSFAKAQQDMLLRFRFKDVGAGAQFKVSTAAWADMPDAELVNIDGVYQQYTITAAMLTELQANGCIISGTSFTLISIEVINPADLKPLTLSVPVTGGDWVFENETPTFIIQATNPYEEAVTANAVISIATDKMSPVTTLTKEVEIAAGATENIELSWTEPTPTAGFFKATCTVNDDLARAFFFGVNPTQIVSAPDKQSDFDSFWQTAKDELAAIEATDEPVLTKIESKSTDKRTVYLVEFKSVSDGDGTPVTVRGYYAEPNDGKKHPVIMHYQGYDSGYRPGGQDATPWCFDGDGDELSADYAEFILSTRGQSINNRPAADRADGIDKDFENTYGDWFAFNFGYKDKYYYRGAYMDCVRAIDFMATRPTSDMTNLYAEGQSQGGAFTYAAAALSGREFKAIAPGIAFMGDFPDYFEIVNWPAYVARECQQALGMSDEEMYAFLSYFDTKNLATKISDKVAVIATIGVQDNVCPPHTNIAPYNNLADGTIKELSFNPENAHQVAANWYDVYMAYFKSKYVEPQPEPEPATPVFDENGKADLSKMEVQDAEKVTYDVETHTVTTTAGWTGVQLTVTDGEEVSGKELRITFDREMAVKCYVKYLDETDADVIMDKAEKILYFTLDETKKLYQVQIQPTDAATFAFEEIKVNQESTKPEPQPVTPVFDENGKADLSKMEVQDAEKVTYDVETHTVTTTAGWTGVQLTVTDGEEVSGKELRITFDRAMKVKCYVKYTDETDADVIMDEAEKILYFTLDDTKKLYQVQIQPTDAATFAFEEIKVNQESTKPEPEPEPGEKTRTENAQKLFDLLQSLYGNKMISGTTAYVDWNIKQAEQVNEWTGNYPAINTYDFINLHASKDVNPDGWLDYSDISGVKKWASEGGLVSAMWHWQVKNNAGTGYTCTPGTDDAATSFDASKVYVDGTAENTLAKQQLSQICGYLKQMQDAGIPVIWRPLHEAAGNIYEYDGGKAWFWWGAQGADVYKQLWQWMYNYMVNEQGLNNLIWVWTSQTKDGSWYPGNAYVDIIGRDSYGAEATQQKNDFDALTASYPNMMVALSECGNTNDASQSDISTVWETGAKWSWFSTWYDAAGSQLHNTQSWWTNAFSQDYVITRAQMKELLDLNIEPDPEPQPEPTTNTFDENGIADLSKVEVQDAGKVTYDATTHTVTTTEGWTGVQLTVADGEQVSGKELRVTFDRAMRVKCYVKYLDETDADVIMDDAAEILYFELDNTKKLYQVQIQPTEAATFAFNEIRVNAESTKPVLKPLEEGEVRTMFEDEEGVVMAWNEICQMDAEWGAILETSESFLVTVKSRTEGSEWPKVILRDANSEGIIEVGLAEVSSYPYIVKMVLTDDVVAKLRNGFRFSGDGITITKIEISKPAPVKEGDVSIEAMNWFRNATYDAATHTGSTSSRWGQFGWAVGDDRYADMTLVIVTIEETSFPVTLKMEYTNTDGKAMATSMGVAAGKTQLNLPLPLDTKVIKKVYLTYADAADVVLTDASVIAGANARPLTGYEDDGTTAVEEAIVNALTKHNTHHIYDLQGRKVSQPVKGLYIIDGRKKVIR